MKNLWCSELNGDLQKDACVLEPVNIPYLETESLHM